MKSITPVNFIKTMRSALNFKKVMTSCLLIVGLSFTYPITTHATTVVLSGSPFEPPVWDSFGIPLADNSLVLVGNFDPSFDITANSDDFAALQANFTQFSTGNGKVQTLFNPGIVIGQVTDNSSAADAFNDEQIYWWIFNATTVNDASEHGIFSSDDPSWIFPINNNGLGDATDLFPSSITQAPLSGTQLNFDEETLLSFQTTPIGIIPEPATYVLIFSGISLAVAFWRRRQQ